MKHLTLQDGERRRFMAGSAAFGVAAGLVGAPAVTAAQLGAWVSQSGVTILLRDPRIVLPTEVVAKLGAEGVQQMPLSGDPVWFWRSTVATVVREPSTTLIGVTSWADLLVFRGLAAESRRRVRQERFDSVAGVFTWLIA